ncbi:MAG TPA: CGNR zinc finger domain-containing protein [Thermoanaerobaculia bacterium]|jgi:predicted RNA-binding Zn ribbon-like protein
MARRKPPPRDPQLELAGALCVAFVNTAGARDNNRQQGAKSYAELVTWAQQAGVLSTNEAERLRRLAAERPEDAEAVYTRAAKLRYALARIFLATLKDQNPDDTDLGTVNAAVAGAMPVLRLVPQDSGVAVGWSGDDDALDRMLWPVAYSALETLVAITGHPHVRQCAAKECALYFLVASGSRKRLFCSTVCGNRARSLEYYYRKGRASREKEIREMGGKRRRPKKSS